MASVKRVCIYIVAVIFIFWSLIPIYYIIRMSFMFESEISAVPMHFIPEEPTITNYLRIFGFTVDTPYGRARPSGYSGDTIRGIFNSIYVAIPVTLITLAVAVPTGYAFGRYRFRGKNTMLMSILFSRALPPVSIIIPYFFFFTIIGLTKTIPGLVIVHLSITIPIIIWVLMGFFATLPLDVEKAARVDGCGRLSAIRRVVIPMASSGIASVAILTFLLSWNEFLFAWILTNGSPAQTLPVVLPQMVFFLVYLSELSTVAVISIIPPVIVGVLFERYITRLRIVDPVTIGGEFS